MALFVPGPCKPVRQVKIASIKVQIYNELQQDTPI